MISRIHHFSVIVSSEKSVLFYEKLGFTATFRKEREYDSVVIMEGYGILLQLFIDPNHPKRAINPENLGLRQVAFELESIDEMRKMFECSEIKADWFGNRYCNTYDPDGLPIQFVERKST